MGTGFLQEIENILAQGRARKRRFEIADEPVDGDSTVDALHDFAGSPESFTIPSG